MRHSFRATVTALLTATASKAASITDVCTVSNVQSILPSNGTLLGIDMLPSTVAAAVVYNATSGQSSTTTYTYCNVTVSYTHAGKNDAVVLEFAFPSPDDYTSRYYVAGGGGYSLSSDATGGLPYGAVGAVTDAGYDAFDYSYDEQFLYGNGSINWDSTHMFAYQALGEMTQIAKAITNGFYAADSGTKIYTYFEGCSDGGREGMSQVQRWGTEYDGVIAGAPALRFSQQQVHHVFSSMVEQTLDYYPPPCELAQIVNATIAACDSLDGRTDGVISRTDLCKLNFNLTSVIGESYYCAATTSSSLGFGFSKRAEGSSTSTTPAQNGTVTAEGVAVAQAIYDGLHNSDGERAYLSWQIGSELSDASTSYNNGTGDWELSIPSTGGMYVAKYIELLDLDNISNLDGDTYDTLVDWMNTGMIRYLDTLQTTLPDLTPFQSSGGKLLHYHGESDPSVPTGSSVHYWQAVRSVMYGNITDDVEAYATMADWYQFYTIPGAAHCGSNSLQPGPYPEDNMATMIDWVENGVKPTALNATVSSGYYEGEVQKLCQWPTRPLWTNNSSTFDCVSDVASIDSWTYVFDAFKVQPVY